MKKTYVLGFMVTPDFQHVVLIRKDTDKPEQQWQQGQLNGIGGGIEAGENGIDAIKREFWEETGVDTSEDVWQYCGSIRDLNSVVYEVKCYMTVAEKSVLDLVAKQPNEREVPGVFYMPLVLSGYRSQNYHIANDVKEILINCKWVWTHWQKGEFRQFQMLTD